MTLRLVIVGAQGRMGQRLCALAQSAPHLEVALALDREDALVAALRDNPADCGIDFSVREAAQSHLEAFAGAGVPLVLGTTGLSPSDHETMVRAGSQIPVLWAPNFSVGVHVLNTLLAQAADVLDDGWDIELTEAHHRDKVDAPSGTARRLLETLEASRTSGERRHGREGLVGPRTEEEIGVHVIRGGDVVGEHTVQFLAQGERVVLQHIATDRDIFARGALRAASWLAGDRAPGLYSLDDVLGGS